MLGHVFSFFKLGGEQFRSDRAASGALPQDKYGIVARASGSRSKEVYLIGFNLMPMVANPFAVFYSKFNPRPRFRDRSWAVAQKFW